MKVIFGLGNPGHQYNSTRHNIGFSILDQLAQTYNGEFLSKPKFLSHIAEISVNGTKVLLVKPQTFYNETGRAARTIVDFYKLDPSSDLLAIHDELALPFGVVRVRNEGSDAGNNGVKSLNAHLGAQYGRLRIGIYTPFRDQIDDADFVLGKFSEREQHQLADIINHAQKLAEDFISGTLSPSKYTII